MMRHGNGGLKGIQRVGFLSSSSPPSSRRMINFPVNCLSDFNDYAVLGLSPFASKTDVKFAYKRLALKTLMRKFEEEEQMQTMQDCGDYDEWDEWMGFEGGMPATYHSC
uniref:J domain-containing protein n=1 Tax=Chenopodium quinoa TaxID=63459 RepID=A0A803M344_CHEQI